LGFIFNKKCTIVDLYWSSIPQEQLLVQIKLTLRILLRPGLVSTYWTKHNWWCGICHCQCL